MSPQHSTRSPLARLVLFMVCLAIAGTFVAGIQYVAIDLPAQSTIPPPANDQEEAREGSPYTPIFLFFPYSPGYQGGVYAPVGSA